ncbi:T9SS type A sorting domain-containing protein [candidate division KSB1 bacterium]|nr:T9SS type A sorting domain-containing protein [candidate division KSB1 bacterium]
MELAPGAFRIYSNVKFEKPADIPSSVRMISDNVPDAFVLEQNFPNPFNPSTEIRYSIPTQKFVTLEIYNVRGQLIRSLVRERQAAGNYLVHWNGTDESGNLVSSGLYLYQLKAGELVRTQKMIMTK